MSPRLTFALVLATIGCGRSAYYDVVLREALTVAPLAADNALWNSYIADDAALIIDLGATACVAPTSYRSCIHAGELRRVDVPQASSCAGLSLVDSLGAFVWQCAERDGAVVFYSTQLADARGLSDLIDASVPAFRAMHVTLHDAASTITLNSPDAVWWGNPVLALSASSGVAALNVADAVYVIAEDATSDGIEITASGVSLLTAPGVSLTGAGVPALSCSRFDVGDMSETPSACLVSAEQTERLWIEITIAPTTSNYLPLAVDHVQLARLANVQIGYTPGNPLQLTDVVASRISGLRSSGAGSIVVVRDSGNLFRDLRIATSDLYIYQTSNSVVADTTTFGGFAGINVNGNSLGNSFVGIVSFSSSAFGLQLAGTGNVANTIAGFTVADTTATGLGFWNNTRTTVHLALVVNSGQQGFEVSGQSATISNLVSLRNAYNGAVVSKPAAGERFAGRLVLGSSNALGSCAVVNAPRDPGLTASCGPQGLSPTSLITVTDPLAIEETFVGWVTTDDPLNQSDSAGTATFANQMTTFDFIGASTKWRGWARASASFLDANERGCPGTSRCWQLASGSAPVRLIDWSLRASHVADLSTNGNITPMSFATGNTCPDAVHGDRVAYDMQGGERAGDGVGNDDGVCDVGEVCDGNVYLLSALELIDDRVGDDDGLCESAEACTVAPNFGAYQGHGDLLGHPCQFQDGIVKDVAMFAYPQNGY